MALKYPLVHVDDVRPENMKKGEGWAISEFRLPISWSFHLRQRAGMMFWRVFDDTSAFFSRAVLFKELVGPKSDKLLLGGPPGPVGAG